MRYLTKQDLEKRLYGIEHYRPGDPSAQDLHLAASSGTTTGLPSLLVMHWPLSRRDRAYQEWIAPLQSTVRLSNNHRRTLRIFHCALMMDATNRIMVLDERDMIPENLSQIMYDYEPETINGLTSRILLWAQTLSNAHATTVCAHIRSLQFFGELFTPLHQRLLKTFFPNALFHGGYASSETATSTTACPTTEENRYHLFKDSPTKLSIADPDENGIGEIIATTHELENYRTGDLGKLDPAPCPCGESPTLVLYGRKDFDIVPVLGALFLKTELERALEPYLEKLADYQLRVGEVLCAGRLVGRAEFDFVPREGAQISETELARHLTRTLFVTKTRTFANIIEDGVFTPLITRRVDEIRRGNKKVPLKKAEFSEPETIVS